MPLVQGSSQAAISENIRRLSHEIGKSPHVQSRRQAIAIAESMARRNRARGGVVPHFDAGGGVDPVNAVITALTAGSNAGGAGIGVANQSAPSSPAATATTATPAATSAVTSVNPAVTPSPAAPATPSSMMQPATAAPAPTSTAAQAPATVTAPPANQGIAGTVNPTSFASPAPQNGIVPATNSAGFASTVPPPATPAAPAGVGFLASGGVAERAGGGFNMSQGPNLSPPWFERQEARGLHVGPVLSNVPGRTDNHQVKVPAGSYVLPAAHVASIGQGNTMAGMSIASKMFGGPYGTAIPKLPHGSLPKPPKPMTALARGGYSEGGARGAGHFEPVPVNISGGEFVIPPWAIIDRFGSLKKGHAALDKWVMDARKREIATQRKLPPPAKK
jgi:hypothetical protein